VGLAGVALGGAVLADDPARPPLRDPEPLLEHLHGSASPRRAYQFPRLISRRASISSSLSATMRLRRVFSRSRLLQPLGIVGLHAAELVAPAVVGLLGDLEVAYHLGQLTTEPFSFGVKNAL
jgi:hypothetical protein